MMWIDRHNAKDILTKKAKERNVTPFFKEEAMQETGVILEEAPLLPVEELTRESIQYVAERIDTKTAEAEAVRQRHSRFSKLRRMNGCTKAGMGWIYANDKNFYRQAVYMESFTDHYAGNEPYYAYRPSYADMTDRQLRTYFTWRTGVRQGYFEQISPSYITLYTYELINRIGVKNNIDGLKKILSFWRMFREQDSSMDMVFFRLAKQYYICYETGLAYQEFLEQCPSNKEEEQKKGEELFQGNFSNKLEYLNSLAAYKIMESRFYTGNEQLLDSCLMHVLKKLDAYYKKQGKSLAEDLAGEMRREEVWHPFSDAIFLETDTFDRRVVVSDVESYERKDGIWYITCISSVNTHGGLIGYILKVMEAELRKLSHFRYKLSPNIKNALADGYYSRMVKNFVQQREYTETIITATHEFYDKANCAAYFSKREAREKLQAEPPRKIEIDSSRFAAIRKEAEAIEKRLIVEEAEEKGEHKPQEAATEVFVLEKEKDIDYQEKQEQEKQEQEKQLKALTAIQEFLSLLTEEERTYLQMLLWEGKPSHSAGFTELLAEAVNEKALGVIGDIVLENGKILVEYEKEIREGL